MAFSFKCPQDFQVESVGKKSLKLSDVKNDDIELWLIKSPVDFDISSLSGHKIKSKFNIHLEETDNIKYVVRKNQNTSELDSYQCLFPHDTNESFALGPSLQGRLDITKVHKIATSTDVQIPTKTQPHFPSGLKQRYVPFGSSSPKRFTKKRKSVNKDTEKCEAEINGFEEGSTKKKKKHKKSKRESVASDVLDETTDVILIDDVETPEKKKKHKKKKKEKGEEEDQSDSIVLVDDSEIPSELLTNDYYPAGDNEQASQKASKHKKKKKKHKESFTDTEKCEAEINGFEEGSTKKKKKHKKSKRESVASDVLDETTDCVILIDE
ncbi:glutamic acid-rich protein isoform X2 [Octopus sinensis]|uniref:Glutamic acid-rich protein isoform X2 n=1 Tax=Octopus sinensis TaxID=2607531 RepID=A0A7E6FJ48_9MOLL|nr:glutamic acid-rich protein isoform X2 [Octopus sinensis]